MDTIIKNVLIYDGLGNKPFMSNIFLKGRKINKISNVININSNIVIDGSGMAICPGFIDTHSHSDLEVFRKKKLDYAIRQGITTEITGQDGLSLYPADNRIKNFIYEQMNLCAGSMDKKTVWTDYNKFNKAVSAKNYSSKIECLVGHGTVRMMISELENRNLNSNEIKQMKDMIEECFLLGVKGMSFSFESIPSCYAPEEEIIEACKVVSKYDGIVMIYLKDDRHLLLESIDMIARIGRESNARMHICQLKAIGINYRGKIGSAIEKIQKYREDGIEITYDVYPYVAMYSLISILLGNISKTVDEILNDDELFFDCIKSINYNIESFGGDENIMITTCTDSKLVGKRLKEIKAQMGLPAAEVVLTLLKNYGYGIRGLFFSIDNEDLEELMKNPLTGICTGGLVSDFPHPRLYGTFPRVINSYAQKMKIMTTEEAIRKMTSEPARRLRLLDRGIIREGMASDLVLFEPEKIRDTNSYLCPKEFPIGIKAVWVNGILKCGEL